MSAMGLPTTVFIMTGFIRTLPNELEDAARMDGASEATHHVVNHAAAGAAQPWSLPASRTWCRSGTTSSSRWSSSRTDHLKTLPQGLTTFMGEYATDYGVLFAGLTLSAAPIILIYIVLSRQFISGMTSGAIK
jgi:raffinose/stachyose/melibiose transport system permease protein